jgi:hypothetical protein
MNVDDSSHEFLFFSHSASSCIRHHTAASFFAFESRLTENESNQPSPLWITKMGLPLEQALIEVWRQALVENAKTVKLGTDSFPVRRTPKRGLRQVDVVFDGNEIRGLEQNPQIKSRWAQMARSGKRVMQFLSEGRYVANVVDGKVTLYGR